MKQEQLISTTLNTLKLKPDDAKKTNTNSVYLGHELSGSQLCQEHGPIRVLDRKFGKDFL